LKYKILHTFKIKIGLVKNKITTFPSTFRKTSQCVKTVFGHFIYLFILKYTKVLTAEATPT